jgi:hypothetical protein
MNATVSDHEPVLSVQSNFIDVTFLFLPVVLAR